ncbi:VWA domain-containing protein [Chlamydiota bacterium]
MRFAYQWYLLLLFLLPFMVLYYRKMKNHYYQTMNFAFVKKLSQFKVITARTILIEKWWIIRIVIVFLFILALSRPQAGRGYTEFFTEGIDIVLAIDVSGSMLAEDFKPNRVESAKKTAIDFIEGRKGDKIGLVVFGKNSFMQAPLTIDYELLKKRVEELFIGIVPEDRTAIGMAIANAINRLRDSMSKNKVIILLTDGMSNSGKIDPITAAQLAKKLGIKIYTVGVGKEGVVEIPVNHPFFGKQYARVKTDVDEETLIKIAELTGGLFFRAESVEALKKIYEEIDELEKTKLEVKEYTDYKELFYWFLIPAIILILFEIVFFNTWGIKIP